MRIKNIKKINLTMRFDMRIKNIKKLLDIPLWLVHRINKFFFFFEYIYDIM